jgi:diguanylate cyclase (GGDEF)-like protein/PAS domain S-box-containing protein
MPTRTPADPNRIGAESPPRTQDAVPQAVHSIDHGINSQVARAIMDNASEGIVITDVGGSTLHVNAAYCRLTGYTQAEAIGLNPRTLKSGHHDAAFYESMWSALLSEGRWEGKIWNRRKDGSIFLENLTIVVLRDAAGAVTHYVGIFTDITHQGLEPAQISELAFYDPLTGLATRELLIEHLSGAVRHAKRRNRRVALFYLNLDDFRQFNKDRGHAIGDAVLKGYAEHLEAVVREEDTVARPGGDEFALVLGDIADPADVQRIADKLLRRLAEPLDHEGQSIDLSASIGISIYPEHGEDAEQLVGLAKGAMNAAKSAGKNRWVMHEPAKSAGTRTAP